MSRKRKRIDANQLEIVEALRAAGWNVAILSGVGNGVPDLLAARAGIVKLIEVKQHAAVLTPAQDRFRIQGWPVTVVRSVDEALSL